MDTLPMDKKNAISDMGFRGLLQLGCKELRYELITWIVANYDISYHRLCMETKVVVPVTPKDVREMLGISDNGVDILIYNRRGTPNRTYDIKILEANLRDLPVGEEFMKSFLIFACATILAPNSKQEVEVRSPLSTTWTDEQVKRLLAAEIHTYGNYSHVQVIQGSKPSAHNDGCPYEADSATLRTRSNGGQSGCAFTPPEEAVNVERKKDKGSTGVHPCSEEMMGKGTGAANTHFGQQRVTSTAVDDGPCIDHNTCPPSQKSAELQSLKGVQMGVQEDYASKQPSPTPRRRFKHTAKRLVKPAAICKSPFVSQYVQLFPKISQQERLVADYALSEDGDPSEILCDMHGTYITRDELSSLIRGRWVNSAQPLACARGQYSSFKGRNLIFVAFKKRYDCGMFAIKCMEHWNGVTLARSIAELKQLNYQFLHSALSPATLAPRNKKTSHPSSEETSSELVWLVNEKYNQSEKDIMHLYRLRLVVTLVTNTENNARDKVLLFFATFNDTDKNYVTRKASYHQMFVKKEELSLQAVKQCKVCISKRAMQYEKLLPRLKKLLSILPTFGQANYAI
uniref:Ubiquitin-like protease family profile domain-containing protein n=1 Tax=Vitis vinifera TaxID=29760 RepID=A5B6E5_VITVI|nr:hypothetical protein VITISV_020154 [Vitis vinifera]